MSIKKKSHLNKKEKKKKNIGQACPINQKQIKKKKSEKKSNVGEAHVQLHMGTFVQKWCPISLFSFSPFWRELFGTTGEKTPRSYHLFSFLPSNQTHFRNAFLPIFFPKFFTHSISPPNKHTLNFARGNCNLVCFG